MKLIHALPIALAASLLPSAGAQVYFGSQTLPQEHGAPYAISARSDGQPILATPMRYPARAALLGKDGSCELTVDADASGRARDASLLACTSPLFEREALRIARTLQFAGARNANDLSIQISWTIETPEVEFPATASLD